MAYRSSASATGTGGTDSVVVNKPTGTAQNDWMLFVVEDAVNTVTWPFTPVATDTASCDGGDTHVSRITAALYKAGASEPSTYTVSIGGGGGINPKITVASFSGRDSATPIISHYNDIDDGSSPRNTNLVTGVTAAAGDDLAFVLMGCGSASASSWVLTDPSGFTSREQQNGTTTYAYGPLKLWTKDNASGAVGTLSYSATLSGQQIEQMGFIVRFAAAAAGTPVSPQFFQVRPIFVDQSIIQL